MKGDYSSFKITKKKKIQKKSVCSFLLKKLSAPYPNTRLQFYYCRLSLVFKITLSSNGFEWKKRVDFLVSEFFMHCDLSVRLFSSKGMGFGFPPV